MSTTQDLLEALYQKNDFISFWNREDTTPEDFILQFDYAYLKKKASFSVASDRDQANRSIHGRSFEFSYSKVCDLRGLQYTPQEKLASGRRDFIHPSADCSVLPWLTNVELKTSVRERWREVSPSDPNQEVHLVTLDEKDVSPNMIESSRGIRWGLTQARASKVLNGLEHRYKERVLTINEHFDRLLSIQLPYEKWKSAKR